ncbi:MAG: lactate dehydrogenase-like 2-hydroxyacid dehydrogenase [Cellvibrionaceae bacterium]|jgi:lactate dehydrogenase-like 2-hydroxyacid dehydrogenase
MSNKPTVLVARQLPEAVEKRLVRDYDARLNGTDKTYSTDELLELAQGAQAIIPCHTENLRADVIARLPASVKAICCFSVGYDHVDLDAAKARGITVTNTPEVLSEATAEIAMLLMLGAARRGYEAQQQIRTDTWADWTAAHQLGIQVSNKRLGILGMGRVGLFMAKFARGFGMEIHYYTRSRLAPDAEQGAIYHNSAEKLLKHSDILSIHCPATPDTHHFLNAERIKLLPDNAIVVNTSRGAIIDDDALIEALESGKLFAAGLDVFNNEPNIDPRYRALVNTFLLPHVGSATLETRDAMGFRALDNLDRIVAGLQPQDLLI